MPRAVKSQSETAATQSPRGRTVSFQVPQTPILALSLGLLVVSFLLGVLATNLAYRLDGTTGTNNVAGTGQPAGAPPAAAPDPTVQQKVNNGHLPPLGNDDAKVTIVEFSDFQCPFCKQLFDATLPQIKKDYVDTGKVKFYYRQLPLTAIHPNAMKASVATECANDQDKFWEMHDKLFTVQDAWASLPAADAAAKFKEYAGELGLDAGTFGSCLDNDEHKAEIDKDIADAGTVAVNGTPGTFVNGYFLSGAVPYDQFKTLIDRELAK